MCAVEKVLLNLYHDQSVFIDAQKLRIQESPDDLRGGEQPQTLDVDVDDDWPDSYHRVIVL